MAKVRRSSALDGAIASRRSNKFDRSRVFGVVLVLLVALVAASPAAGATPPTILDSYRAALQARRTPENMEFEYTVTRSGPNRVRTEQHRVYWTSAGAERNDTISVNGTPLIPAASKMLHRNVWPYDVAQFAVSSAEYDATPAGGAIVSGRKTHAFTLARNAPADFMLKTLYVDAKSRLPVRETFSVVGPNCEGNGMIEFGETGPYWLPNFVSVVCMGTPAGISPAPIFKESIRFSGYTFPAAIPADVFGAAPSSQPAGEPGSTSP